MVETVTQPLRFERQVCGRCGGTGEYSYNQMSGSRCFGCDGKREVLTAKGRRQAAYVAARLEVRAGDVKLGDRIATSSGKFNVVEIKHFPKELKTSGTFDFKAKEYVWHDAIALQGKTMGIQCEPDYKVQRVLSPELHRALVIEALNTVK